MFNFKSLKCSNCNSVITNLPEAVITQLDGCMFICDCCNQLNILRGFTFDKIPGNNPAGIFDFVTDKVPA